MIKAFKGFDKGLKCRGFQYEIGKEYETDRAKCCESGFHACESPLDVFGHYPPASSRYCEVELDGKTDRDGKDSKIAASKIKIGAEIGIPGLVKAQIEWVKAHITTEHTDPEKATAGYYGAATAGNYGAATAGYRGAATAGDSGAATAGYSGAATAGDYGAATSRGSAAVGKNGIACVRGNGVKVKGGIGAVLVIGVENDGNYDLKEWKAFGIDGEQYKPDTWYTLKDGEIVEVEE